MNEILRSTSDEWILNMQENKAKEVVAKMKIYGMCHLICKQFYYVYFDARLIQHIMLLSVDDILQIC